MVKQQFKVFNRQGKFLKNVNIGEQCKFSTFSDLRTYLKEQGLFAHNQMSFNDRPYWKGWSFKKKLENLGWEFGMDGTLINTQW